jgi:mono/diheme cytochrome c family protein
MREEVQQSSYALHEDDLRAIAVYLKSLPGQDDTRSPVAADDPAMKAGEAIYTDQCSACHMRSGKGIPRLFPSLAGAPTVQQPNVTSLERVVLQGAQSAATPGAVTGPAMPSYGWMLSDDEVASVLTYIRNAWGNAAPAVTAASVKDARESLRQRSD